MPNRDLPKQAQTKYRLLKHVVGTGLWNPQYWSTITTSGVLCRLPKSTHQELLRYSPSVFCSIVDIRWLCLPIMMNLSQYATKIQKPTSPPLRTLAFPLSRDHHILHQQNSVVNFLLWVLFLGVQTLFFHYPYYAHHILYMIPIEYPPVIFHESLSPSKLFINAV